MSTQTPRQLNEQERQSVKVLEERIEELFKYRARCPQEELKWVDNHILTAGHRYELLVGSKYVRCHRA